MPNRRPGIAGIILTGGQSTRMGRDKALLPLGGKPLWRTAAERLTPFVESVVFIGEVPGFSPPAPYRLFPDMPPGLGPLGGIATGLEVSGCTHHLLLAVDYPFVRPEYLRLLLSRSDDVLAVCGRSQSALEPLIAYYHADCAKVIRKLLSDGETRTHVLFDRVPSLILTEAELNMADPKRMSHVNINSPDDLANALLLGDRN